MCLLLLDGDVEVAHVIQADRLLQVEVFLVGLIHLILLNDRLQLGRVALAGHAQQHSPLVGHKVEQVDASGRGGEAAQEKQIAHIAEEIAKGYERGVRIVLISGPSSSGKTTFCKRLQVQLTTNLLRPIGLSLDDYFLDRENTPRDEHGEYDFESLYALDLPYFFHNCSIVN